MTIKNVRSTDIQPPQKLCTPVQLAEVGEEPNSQKMFPRKFLDVQDTAKPKGLVATRLHIETQVGIAIRS